MSPQSIDTTSFEKALKTLEEACEQPPQSDLERDGVIQHFEYCFELSWKFIRRYLIALGRVQVSSSPRPLIRDPHQEGWINSPQKWFTYLEARSLSSHTYDTEQAKKVYDCAKTFHEDARQLLNKLKSLT